ncbi:phage tail tape measure protein [uncultured Selenomonas sp.]|jgi:TP901 family phage tail tape measure protein|uniref:phage tail tape measure protein n=1 Tax=uncultured Selenomonas sp. TaxID=159275 RepID=UPI002638BBF0|nr:phage tail tape measure protein [uncultured Selenomonas sp.]
MSDYVLSAVLRLKDELTGRTKRAQESLNGIKGAAQGAGGGLNNLERDMHRAGSAVNELAGRSDRLKNSLSGIRGDYSPTIRVRDNASGKIGGIRSMLNSISGKIHTVTVNVRQNGGLSGLASKAGGAVSGVAGGMMMGTGMQMAGAAGIGFGIYDTVKTYMDFEAEMKRVQAISGASQGDFESLTAKAKEMGATTQFSATESAQALEYMAMAGWKTDEMLSGISGIMSLAAASGEDLGSVSDIVTDALTAFGLKASDSAHFADVLAQAASNANTNVGMMGYTFKYVAPIAGALKYSVEDVGVSIGLMANAGIKAEQAGTSLRAIMTRLVAPPKKAAKAMAALELSVKNADGSMKPWNETMLELRAKFAGLTDAEKTQMAASIAGQEAMSGFLAMVNASDADFEKLTAAIGNADGAADHMAKTVNDNLKGDLKALSSTWEAFQLEFMEGKGSEGLRSFVQGVRDDVAKFKTYVSDGFDISDVGKIAMDVVVQLKDKFLELDGVGSILAGGALAAALYKITSLSKKAYSGVKGFFTSSGGGKTGLPGGASAVSTMTVHAGTVIIHAASVANAGAGGGVNLSKGGKGAAGAGVSGAAGAAGNGGRAGKLLKSGGKFIKGGGWLAALGAGIGIYDAYSTNDEAAAEAAYGVDAAQEDYENKLADGTATEEDLAAVDAAKAYQQETEDYNKSRMGGAVGSGVGSLAGAWAGAEAGAAGGAAIGALFGGVGAAPGAAIGGVLGMIAGGLGGSELGEMLGSGIVENFDGAVESIKEGWADLSGWFTDAVWTPISDAAITGINVIVGIAALGWELIKPYWEQASAWFDSTVWQPIANTAEWAWTGIRDFVTDAWDWICGQWATASEWFNSTVWQPISQAVEPVKTTITSAFDEALSFVKGIWNGVASWFEANVINPIKEKFQGLIDLKNKIADAGSAVTGLTTSNGTGHNAIGTSYWGGGWTEVNEHGGEIIDLPQGSRVYPHATTMKMLKDGMGGGTSASTAAPQVTVTGNTFTVREEADIDRIVYRLYQLMFKSHVNMNGGTLA